MLIVNLDINPKEFTVKNDGVESVTRVERKLTSSDIWSDWANLDLLMRILVQALSVLKFDLEVAQWIK